RYRTEIVMENMQLGPRGAADSGNAPSSPAPTAPPTEEQIPIIDADENLNFANDENEGVNVKDIPF
ncbi:MAG: hypothetical protein AAB956_02295, partial [Patescibacteria group bacterium]